MKLCILTVEPTMFETKRIVDEALKRGHATTVMIPEDVNLSKPLLYDAVLARAIKTQTKIAKEIMKIAHQRGIVAVDEKLAKGKGQNKLENYKLFESLGLYVPMTIALNDKTIDEVLQFPSEEIVLKQVGGKRGMWLYKVRKENLKEQYEKLKQLKKKYMAQEYVPINKEYRLIFVGDRYLGGIQKKAEDWIHNISQGAVPLPTSVPQSAVDAAKKAKDAVETEIAGIDVAETAKGLFVIEVNRSPGFKGFEYATGKNVAYEIVKYVEEKVKARKK